MKTTVRPQLVPRRVAYLLTLLPLAGCLQKIPAPPDQSSFSAIERRSARLLREGRSGDDRQSAPARRQVVFIDGNDILLPEATPDQVSSEQSYHFDISIEDPEGRTMAELIRNKAFRIETPGVDSTLVYPVEPVRPVAGQPTTPAPTLAINTGTARIRVSTRDGVLRPFTIRAWYPGKADAPDFEAWSATRAVKVYYGDIRTRVQIVSRTEAEGMFGSTFAEHFHVGRVFLRNRSTTKSLAVYTTSMRVPVVFYRKTDLPGGLSPVAVERLERLAEANWSPDTKEKDLLATANDVVTKFLDRGQPWGDGDPFGRTPPSPDQRYLGSFTQAEKDALSARVLVVWSRLADEDKDRRAASMKLSLRDQQQLIDAAIIGKIPGKTVRPDADKLVGATFGAHLDERQRQRGSDLVQRVWQLRAELLQSSRERAVRSKRELTAITDDLPTSSPPKEQEQRYNRIRRELEDIHSNLTANTPVANPADELERLEHLPTLALLKQIEEVTDNTDRAAFTSAATAVPRLARELVQANTLAAHLESLQTATSPSGGKSIDSVRSAIRDLRERALWQSEPGDKKTAAPRRAVNLGGQALGLSPDPHLQRQLVESGYVWRDAYRPMTFQAVLNSVMFTHANNPRTLTVRVMETIATIAGGAIGLSGDPARSALRTTNFFSTVLVPALRTTIVEDLNKHITNLGEMAMDTVIIIPPNDSVDRYVFFPRGAIYNFPDEFDSATPAYIRGVEGDELFVEAVPVNTDQVVRGGAVDASALVSRALNEGERAESARLLSIAQTQAKLRTVELANLVARIDSVMAAAKQGTESLSEEAKTAKLEAARDEARKMTANFTAFFGPDQSGVLAATVTKHGIVLQGAPPVALPGTPLRLPVGTTSVSWKLNITDPDTPIASLTLAKKAEPSTDDWLESVTFDKADSLAAKAVIKLKKTALTESVRKEVTVTVSDPTGNAVGFVQPVEIVPIKFEVPKFTPQEGSAGNLDLAKDPGAYELKIGRKKGTMVVTVPTHQADASLLKLGLLPAESGLAAYVDSTTPATDRSAGMVTLTLVLDTSLAASDATNPVLTIHLVPAGTAAEAKAITDASLAQIKVTLNLASNP